MTRGQEMNISLRGQPVVEANPCHLMLAMWATRLGLLERPVATANPRY